MLNRSASLEMSTSVLKALPGKHDIKRHSPSILYLGATKRRHYIQICVIARCDKRTVRYNDLLKTLLKGDSNPNDKYVLSERALRTMNFDTSMIKIGCKMGKSWAFKEFNMADI